MRVVIIGAGQVGESIADDLDDTHEVVVVERDSERCEELTYSLDVLTVNGDGTSVDTLEEAGVADAEIVIASTDDDETNIVACSTVKAITDAFTIARVKATEYLKTWRRSETAFGIDFMVCTNLLTAQSVVRVVGLPAALDVDPFAGGKVQMAEFEVASDSEVVGETVAEADRFDSLTFVAVLRNGDVVIPTGETVISGGDRLVVIGSPESVRGFAPTVASREQQAEVSELVVVGGSEIGYHVARLFEDRGISVRVIEQDPDRARELAELLPDSVVLQSDATDVEFLEREHVGDADVLVSALDADEKNLLACLLGKRLGVGRTVSIVDSDPYIELFETVGVDVAISPRAVVAEEITRFTRENRAENVALIESHKAEVIEIEIEADSPLAGRTIQESVAQLPERVVFGAITRNDSFVTPRGDTVIETGDHVVAFAPADVVADLTAKL
ncbi:Trk system potassium transporter TrkA [Halorarum salinum]|uniref:Trk system potassium transporter TrkA n=1 Tax=Halorarum salinum TaxID=2743089 RepID=A0A7D5LCN5_9EURY|nr:Trk system potassium transporter TrkA [Halobaculum salinum]QLG62895.1 Trk system potassium transporter TrkA [Halobaculum salinum]